MKFRLPALFLLVVCLSSPFANAHNPAGVAAGATLTAVGGLALLISGIVAAVEGNQPYCDANSQFSQMAVVGHHDCSYQICAVAIYQGSYYTCQYYGNAYSGYQNCEYSRGGYSQCIVWQTVPQTCDDWGCKDPNSSNFGPVLHRKQEPEYSNSLYAIYASVGVLAIGLATLIPSLCVRSDCAYANSPI